jgi:hypothetical protein
VSIYCLAVTLWTCAVPALTSPASCAGGDAGGEAGSARLGGGGIARGYVTQCMGHACASNRDCCFSSRMRIATWCDRSLMSLQLSGKLYACATLSGLCAGLELASFQS